MQKSRSKQSFKEFLLAIFYELSQTYNRGQNLLGHMSFALKEAFPVRKLLPNGGGVVGVISNRNFLQNTKWVMSFVLNCSMTSNARQTPEQY